MNGESHSQPMLPGRLILGGVPGALQRRRADPHPLEGISLKLARAEDHLKTLRENIDEFLRNEPYGVAEEFDPQTGQNVLRARVGREIPPLWSILIGDWAHNVRSALDHLAWQLASTGGRTPPRGTEFPIFADKKGRGGYFQRDNRGEPVRGSGLWKVRGIRKRPQTIIQGLQAYQRGKQAATHPLWQLQELNIRDKHRLLNFAASHVSGAIVYNERRHITPVYGPFEDGAILVYLGPRDAPKAKMNVDFELLFDVAFDEKGPAGGRGVRGTLALIREPVEDAVERLEPFLSYPRVRGQPGLYARGNPALFSRRAS